jgi:cytochrome c oxidase cbb3-type subunit 1
LYVIRALGGALVVAGALIMAWNLWMTVFQPEGVEHSTLSPALAAAR